MKLKVPLRYLLLWSLLSAVLAAMVGLMAWTELKRGGGSKRELAVYGQVPEFSLIERSGRPLSLSDLKGRVWIADFIFTRCAGPCPLMSAQMASLQRSLAKADDVRLVSFSVDPEHDTPEMLSGYADRYGADKGRWLFLTGDKMTIYRLAVDGFHLGAKETTSEERAAGMEPIIHSSRFVLVDAEGQIRGYYDGTERQALRKLLADVETLLRSKGRD